MSERINPRYKKLFLIAPVILFPLLFYWFEIVPYHYSWVHIMELIQFFGFFLTLIILFIAIDFCIRSKDVVENSLYRFVYIIMAVYCLVRVLWFIDMVIEKQFTKSIY